MVALGQDKIERNKALMKPIVIIPARMASTRLPGKPLADIAGVPMIVRVWRQAMAANIGPVIVAAAEREIAQAVEQCRRPRGDDRTGSALGLGPGLRRVERGRPRLRT